MPKYSLHIGLNTVDSSHYGSALEELPSCLNDANAMKQMADYLGFAESNLLLEADATADKVKAGIKSLAAKAKSEDMVLISYSGHGGRMPNLNEDVDAEEVADQTWCLYDRQLIDDELGHLWPLFKEGVHILLMLDSCHSGTAARMDDLDKDPVEVRLEKLLDKFFEEEGLVAKAMPNAIEDALYLKHQDLYDAVIQECAAEPPKMKAGFRLLSACQDDQLARAGSRYSRFTLSFLQIMARFAGSAVKNYDKLYELLLSQARTGQTPNLFKLGESDQYFTKTFPFMLPGEYYPQDVKAFFEKLRRGV